METEDGMIRRFFFITFIHWDFVGCAKENTGIAESHFDAD